MNFKVGKAFSPGHISAFFEIHDKGSRGAGICISKGVRTVVKISKARTQDIEVYLNGHRTDGTTNEFVIRKFIRKRNLKVIVKSELQLPIAQGFGLSGAGALSTALATARALNLNYSFLEITRIAFDAELFLKTGLGDVVAEAFGGFVLRLVEGMPPAGFVELLPYKDSEIVICIIGKPFYTKTILESENYKKLITKMGKKCIAEFLKCPDIKKMFECSLWFGEQTGILELAAGGVKKAIYEILDLNAGCASMTMLGNAVFATGDTKKIVSILKKYGTTCVCNITKKGAKIV